LGRHKSKPAATPTVLGGRIRQLRKARGLTLKELGGETDLSHAFLSQVERGLAQPSVTTLADISVALRVSPAALLSQPSTGFAQLVRRDTAPTVFVSTETAPVDCRALTGENASISMVEIRGPFERSELMAHPGEEAIYVVEGEIEVIVADEPYVLGPGDVLTFDCSVIHTYRAVGSVPPRFLVIVVDPGQYANPLDESVYESRQAPGAGAAAI
jgi:transcriptional regulator with XRE-family HTH domain